VTASDPTILSSNGGNRALIVVDLLEDVSMEAAVEPICAVPDNRKARAVTDYLTGEVVPNHPSSILQEHPAPFCFLDEGSASRLRKS